MAKLSRAAVAKKVALLLVENPAQKNQVIRQLAAYLMDIKQTACMHLFINDIANELLLLQGSLGADVITAFGLTSGNKAAVVKMLKAATNAKTVELNEIIDPSIIGGVVIKTPNLQLDASIKRQITQLAGGM